MRNFYCHTIWTTLKSNFVFRSQYNVFLAYLATLQPVLVLSLQLIQGGPETSFLLWRNSGVRLVQEGAS